jgi:plasmid maintenance system antidote protein VapI
MECVSEKDMVEMLRDYIRERGTQKMAAQSLGISSPFLSDILLGKREVSDNVARKLGFSKIHLFARIEEHLCEN